VRHSVRLPSAVALALCVSGCANVWGLQTLESNDPGSGGDAVAPTADAVADAPSNDSRPVTDAGGGDAAARDAAGRDAAEDDDGDAVGPDAPPDALQGDAGGACAADVTVVCSDPAQAGFTCTGSATPSQSLTPISCTTGPSAGSFCCTGNWCGQTTDTDSCDQCILQSCASVVCLCGSQCMNYYQCVDTCFDTLQNCESSCAPGYAANDVTAGNDIFACAVQYCNSECLIL
jgi:hypothetical protein